MFDSYFSRLIVLTEVTNDVNVQVLIYLKSLKAWTRKKTEWLLLLDLHKCQSSEIEVTLYKSNFITFPG